ECRSIGTRLFHFVVRMRGLEPPRCHHHRLLRPARLPVPPHPRTESDLTDASEQVSRKPANVRYGRPRPCRITPRCSRRSTRFCPRSRKISLRSKFRSLSRLMRTRFRGTKITPRSFRRIRRLRKSKSSLRNLRPTRTPLGPRL